MAHGLDRTAFNAYNTTESPICSSQQRSAVKTDDGDDTSSLGTSPHTSKTDRVKAKAKKILHLKSDSSGSDELPAAPTLAPSSPGAIDDERLVKEMPSRHRPVKEMIRSPVDTVKSALRGSSGKPIADAMHNTAISHGADVRLVQAHDKIATTNTEAEKQEAVRELNDLKDTRQDMFVRWTTDRHIREIRVFPKKSKPWRARRDFIITDAQGIRRMQWAEYGSYIAAFAAENYGAQYIGASSDSQLPPANEDDIKSSMERLLLSSTPCQGAIMRMRRIYRWEDRKKTMRYLVGYFCLWMFNSISSFAILAVIVLVLKQRFYPPTMEDFRDDIERSEDDEKTAHTLAQLIERHGTRGWVDALMKDAGPIFDMQLEDAANLLERAQNFYEWRHPIRTIYSLVLFSIVLVAVTFTPTWLLVKSSMFFAGVSFFASFPISSRYPQYRLLVSPVTWLLWDIPTHAEWAVARIQAEARHNKGAIHRIDKELKTTDHISKDDGTIASAKDAVSSSTNGDADRDNPLPNNELAGSARDEKEVLDPEPPTEPAEPVIEVGQYKCMSCDHLGKLSVSSAGLRFETVVRSNEMWTLSFTELKSMKKVQQSINRVPFNYGDEIQFVREDNAVFKVHGLATRDEVFTQIIGYSGLRWLTIC